jgi:hypothetical protein
MMKEIKVTNVNQAMQEGFWHLKTCGVQEASRGGLVIVAPDPVVTTYTRPMERVLFCPQRDANCTFHLMEALWMLAGAQKVDWLLQFNREFFNYAEPDGVMHGAYGYRWRKHFGGDQLMHAIDKLTADPNTRQAVISMWSPEDDLVGEWRDRPCNTHIYFDLRGGVLNMTVCCRSNDALWGAYGSNVVHFSMLQELIASALNALPGVYRQFSNNFHVYQQAPNVGHFLMYPPAAEEYDAYTRGVRPFPMLDIDETYEQFLLDCEALVQGKNSFYTKFVHEVAYPMMQTYLARKYGEPYQHHLTSMADCDWKVALVEWINRRSEK